jgi:hypothetical protein
MQTARISHKKAILRADVPAVTATLTYLRALEAAYEVEADREGPVAAMHHDNTYDHPFTLRTIDVGDISNGGYHLDRHQPWSVDPRRGKVRSSDADHI